MRILFAACDRDLLRCYQSILSEAFGEAITAFDGARALTLLAEGDFDMVILDRELPRVDHRRILRRLTQRGTPSILLQARPVSAHQLLEEPLPSAYLSYPFLPEELTQTVAALAELRASRERLRFADIDAAVSELSLGPGAPLSAGEAELLLRLQSGRPFLPGRDEPRIAALNEKFIRLKSRARIRYRAGEGFQLVTEDE